MDKEVRRELVVVAGNMLLLKLTAAALKSGQISTAEFAIISECMSVVMAVYEVAHPVPVIPEGNGTVN